MQEINTTSTNASRTHQSLSIESNHVYSNEPIIPDSEILFQNSKLDDIVHILTLSDFTSEFVSLNSFIFIDNFDIFKNALSEFSTLTVKDYIYLIYNISIGKPSCTPSVKKHFSDFNNPLSGVIFQQDNMYKDYKNNNVDTIGKQFVNFNSYDQYIIYLLSLPMNIKNFYETVHSGIGTKLYFDIDMDVSKLGSRCTLIYCNQVRDHIIDFLLNMFPSINLSNDVIIMTAHQDSVKYSMHIVLNKYYFTSDQFEYIYLQLATYINSIDKTIIDDGIIDQSIYRRSSSSLKEFRGIYNTKFNGNRYLKFETSWTYGATSVPIIHNFDVIYDKGDKRDAIIQTLMYIFKSSSVIYCYKRLESSTLAIPSTFVDSIKNRSTVSNIMIDDVIVSHCLDLFPDKNNFSLQNITNGIIALKRINPSICVICSKNVGKPHRHDNNGQFITIDSAFNIKLRCHSQKSNKNYEFLGVLPVELRFDQPTSTPTITPRSIDDFYSPAQVDSSHDSDDIDSYISDQSEPNIDLHPLDQSEPEYNIIDIDDLYAPNNTTSLFNNNDIMGAINLALSHGYSDDYQPPNYSEEEEEDEEEDNIMLPGGKYMQPIDLCLYDNIITGDQVKAAKDIMKTYIAENSPNSISRTYIIGHVVYPQDGQEHLCPTCKCLHKEHYDLFFYRGSIFTRCGLYSGCKTLVKVIYKAEKVEKSQADIDNVKLKYLEHATYVDNLLGLLRHLNQYTNRWAEALKLHVRIQLMESDTGTGKTTALISYMNAQRALNPDHSFLIITSKRTLNKNMVKRLADAGIFIISYDQHKDKVMANSSVQLESLPRVGKFNFDTVIIDECTSFLKAFNSKFHVNLSLTKTRIEEILRNSDKLIMMDSFIEQRTFKFVHHIYGNNTDVYHHLNDYVKSGSTAVKYDKYDNWVKHLLNLATDGKTICIAVNNASIGRAIFKSLSELGINARLYDKVTLTSKDHYLECEDPENNWQKYDCVIYSPSIEVGVDFSKLHFDYIFQYCTNETTNARSCSQQKDRVRLTTTQELHLFIKENNYNPPLTVDSIYDDIQRQLNCRLETKLSLSREIPSDFYEKNLKMVDQDLIDEYTMVRDYWSDLYVDNILEDNWSKAHFGIVYDIMLEKQGYNIISYDDYTKIHPTLPDVIENVPFVSITDSRKIDKQNIKDNYNKVYDETVAIIVNNDMDKISSIGDRLRNPNPNMVEGANDIDIYNAYKVLKHIKVEHLSSIDCEIYFKVRNNIKHCLQYLMYSHMSTADGIMDIFDYDESRNRSICSYAKDEFLPKAIIMFNICRLIKSISNEQGVFFYENLEKLIQALRSEELVPGLGIPKLYETAKTIFKTRRSNLNTSRAVGGFFDTILKNFSMKIKTLKHEKFDGKNWTHANIGFINNETYSFINKMIPIDLFNYQKPLNTHIVSDKAQQEVDKFEKILNDTIKRYHYSINKS